MKNEAFYTYRLNANHPVCRPGSEHLWTVYRVSQIDGGTVRTVAAENCIEKDAALIAKTLGRRDRRVEILPIA